MSLAYGKNRTAQLPPNVNRILLVKNLPFKITAEEMFDLFGKYGAIRQIRMGTEPTTKGTAFVVYEDIYDAKEACDHLQGFNVMGRYLIVLYYQTNHRSKKTDLAKEEERIAQLRQRYKEMNPDGDDDLS
ncbi:RNA-binding domain-containing protein [Linderina pennispora]|uniref:RNA-binding domain-containing protein n=1 Tax=Linderina pennispora TaxID=61395 RepID=A0A1Y1W743_9FUNG|nr:RNA-binding domain-containing protein [Linderina pennispora]ORX69252.1 RNA-binding domain-containing protein [Linderina pennispora]